MKIPLVATAPFSGEPRASAVVRFLQEAYMNIVFMGTPDFAEVALEKLLETRHSVSAVVTQPDKPKGRSGKLTPSPVKELALSNGIPVLQPERLRNEGIYDEIESYRPDVIVVVAFGQIVPSNILKMPKYGCINVHASLLPKYRGAAPIQWALLDGENETGVTIMQMDEGLDTGDMLRQRTVAISDDDTVGSLFDKLAVCGGELLCETLDMLENPTYTIEPIPQPETSPTPYARMIKKTDGLIDWKRSADELDRHIRGMYPWPGAFTYLDGKMIKILNAKVVKGTHFVSQNVGEIVKADKGGLYVMTGKSVLSIEELQAEGRKRMRYDDFLRGSGELTGKHFEYT